MSVETTVVVLAIWIVAMVASALYLTAAHRHNRARPDDE